MTHVCVTQREGSTAGEVASVSARGREGHGAPGIQAWDLNSRRSASWQKAGAASVRGGSGCTSRALQDLRYLKLHLVYRY